MSKIWSGLKSGLKFNCTACGKCCNNKRSNVSLNLSEVESMSEALGMDKLSFIGKYTEEKVIDGLSYTKLMHKKDLSCVLLDIDGKECTVHASRPIQCRSYPFMAEYVIGEAEWFTESRKCEGIVIDDFFSSSKSVRIESVKDEEMSIDEILYDGVTADYENTYHGNLNIFYAKNLKPITGDVDNKNEMKMISPNNEKSVNSTVLPDTIIRQMILHEIHSNGLGPDWNYQDSLELLLESENDSFANSSGNILDNFKNEFCETHHSKIIYEDKVNLYSVNEKKNLLRVVDTTVPKGNFPELLLNIGNNCKSILSDNDYKYDIEDLKKEFKFTNVYNDNDKNKNNNLDKNDESSNNNIENNSNEDDINIITETRRRFEFIHSDSLSQTEMFFLPDGTPGFGGKCDHSRLIMPIHQILGVISEKILLQYNKKEVDKKKKMKMNMKNNIKNDDKNMFFSNSVYRWSVIGAGGFALPSYFDYIISKNNNNDNNNKYDIIIDAVEPEKKILKIAKEYFHAKYHICPENYNYNSNENDCNNMINKNVLSHQTDGLTYLQKYFPLNKMIKIWNGSGYHMEEEKNENKNSKEFDFLILDAFEDSPENNFGPVGMYCNRAPPVSLLSDIDLLVRSLKPRVIDNMNNVANESMNTNNELSNKNINNQTIEYDITKEYNSHLMDMININKEGECSGGILAINLFGPIDWINEVYNKINNCSDLSSPILIRIKDQKNVLLITSRIS